MCNCNENKSVCQCPKKIDWTKPIQAKNGHKLHFVGTIPTKDGKSNYVVAHRPNESWPWALYAIYLNEDGVHPSDSWSVINVPPPKKKGITFIVGHKLGKSSSSPWSSTYTDPDRFDEIRKRLAEMYTIIAECAFEYEDYDHA